MLNVKQIKELAEKINEAYVRNKEQLVGKYFDEYKWRNMSEDKLLIILKYIEWQLREKMTNEITADSFFLNPSHEYSISYMKLDRRYSLWIDDDIFPELKGKMHDKIPELDAEIKKQDELYKEMKDLLFSHPNEDEVNTLFEYVSSNIVEPVCTA